MDMPEIQVFSAEDFRAWLKKNHAKESKVRLIIHKKHTGKTSPSHRHLIEEAICWGWIDTTIKRIDEDTFSRNFSKRNENSKWSDNTLSYARALVKAGRMQEQGMHFYKKGKAKPTHDHGIPKNPDMPVELKKALAKNRDAKRNFEKVAPSMKRTLYRYILRGVQATTREKRVDQIVASYKRSTKSIFRGSTENV
jgi:uncharacterized protein YdeI (YjbR/CyaY-like superfamily)